MCRVVTITASLPTPFTLSLLLDSGYSWDVFCHRSIVIVYSPDIRPNAGLGAAGIKSKPLTVRMKDASGEGKQECWFGEGGCLESSGMESGSWRDCC